MISEIKLKRTDTTLDLSQKAKLQKMLAKMYEKGRFGGDGQSYLFSKKVGGRRRYIYVGESSPRQESATAGI